MHSQDLATRIERLEDENRRLKRSARRWALGLAALGGVAVLSSMTSVVCKTVWAERFVLKDAGGRDRGFITAYETGGAPQFALLDARGKQTLSLGVDDDGRAYIEVAGKSGPVRSHFAVSPEGAATIESKSSVGCEKASESKCKGDDVASTN